ncbi:MAG: AsmA family protein, partial [Microvirga sp.]
MRDILTVLASIVILILAAAVAAPPFIDWEAQRSTVDQIISRATGVQAHTEGRINVRLLPSPRLRFDRLRLGPDTAEAPSLTADFVSAEFALPPLLRGEVRFTDTRVGRADIRIPVSSRGDWRLPADLVAGSGRGREWAVENLAIAQFLLTTRIVDTGRTDQFYAENVNVEGQKLIGPWRIEGSTSGVPFRFTTGELSEDKTVQVKLSGGGDTFPRFDVEARLSLNESTADTLVPALTGKAKLLFGPPAQVAAAGIPIPISIDTEFATSGDGVKLGPIQLDAGEGGASLRMTGEGSIGLGDPKIALKLEGRRLDADSFILSSNGQDFKSRLAQWAIPTVTVPIDLDLKIDSVGLGQEDIANASARLSIDRGLARIERIGFTAPGETQVTIEGEAGLATQGGAEGRLAVISRTSDRLARYLDRLGLRSPFLKVLDGRPFEIASDVSLAYPVVSLSRLRVKTGDATL